MRNWEFKREYAGRAMLWWKIDRTTRSFFTDRFEIIVLLWVYMVVLGYVLA